MMPFRGATTHKEGDAGAVKQKGESAPSRFATNLLLLLLVVGVLCRIPCETVCSHRIPREFEYPGYPWKVPEFGSGKQREYP